MDFVKLHENDTMSEIIAYNILIENVAMRESNPR